MTTIRCTGASAEAARVLIEGSALGRVLNDFGSIHYDLPRLVEATLHEDDVVAILSTGEHLLWDALAALSGPGAAGLNVWSAANVLDVTNARALHDAVGIALGVRMAPTPVPAAPEETP